MSHAKYIVAFPNKLNELNNAGTLMLDSCYHIMTLKLQSNLVSPWNQRFYFKVSKVRLIGR